MAANNRGGDAQIGFQKIFLGELKRGMSSTNLDGKEVNVDHAAAVALQRAWRKRSAYVFVKDLKQEKLCRDMREEMRAGLHVDCEACSSAGKKSADIKSRNQKKAWKDTDELLFKGMARVQMSDRGDNWNDRWQRALSLPNKTKMDITYKRMSLDAVYSDFVHTAVTYGRTIISEYFLHEYMKSVKPKRLGGVAGGKKYLWRGILFKLADGSQGPYGGSDEAAAKAAGHELRGASEYLRTGVGLYVPPMCLLDYKGFRMLAQAHLPLGETSLKMGTNDGGRTVLNDCPILDRRTAMAAKALGLRAHIVGGRQALVAYRDPETGSVYRKKRNVGGQILHAAADVEGHEGIDSRMYLLDLARAFPPEDPDATPHLSGMLSVSAKVVVQKEGQKAKAATVTKAHATLVDYDILHQDGTMEKAVPAHLLRDLRLFIFYRLMRPEFVRDRGRTVLGKVNLPADHKFATVKVTNPMMFAIKYARSAVVADEKKKKAAAAGAAAAASAGGKTTTAAASSSTASGQRDRYTTGAVLEDVAPSGGPAGRPSAYSRARTDLTPVSETSPPRGGGITPADPAIGAYESFGGGGGSGGYSGNGGGDSGGSGGLGDKDGGKANEAWKIKAMECGIEFVSTKDKYFEGFEEVVEDEEEIKRRGGIGYSQFRESDPLATGGAGAGAGGGYDAADLTLNDDEEEGEEEEDDEPVSVPPPDMPEKRVFERVGMVQRGSTFGPKTGDRLHEEGEESGTSRSQADRNIWGGAAREEEEEEEEEEPTTESSSDEGDSFFGGKAGDNYTCFDTASESSSMFSTGGAPVRTNSDLLLLLAQNAQMPNGGGVGGGVNPASSPANLLRHNRGGGGGGGSNHGFHASQRKPAAALTAEGGYDTFSHASLNSSSSQDPGSPVMVGFRAAAAATSSKRGVTFPDARPIGGGGGGDKAEGHRAFPPAGGGGYDQFSSKSLASNASSVMSVPAAQAAAAGDRRVREALGGGVDDGDDDDDEIIDVGGGEEAAAAKTGYSAFNPSSRNGSSGSLASASTQATGRGGALGHARVEPTSSSTEGTFRGGGGGGGGHGGGLAATFPRSHDGHSRPAAAAAAAGAFAGPSAGRSSSPPATAAQVSTNDRDNGGRRQRNSSSSSSVSKLWQTAGESQERPAAATAEISSDYGEDNNVGEGGGGGRGGAGGEGSGYDRFHPRASLGYDGFHDHDSHGELPPPRGLGGAAGYDNFSTAGSDRSVDGSLASSSAFGGPQLPPPPPPSSSSPPEGWSSGTGAGGWAPTTRAVVADEGQKKARAEAAAAAAAELPAPSENGGQRAAGDGGEGGDGGPPPLSPDALTAFSNGDPEAKARNRDVTEATQFLLTVLVPATARLLCSMPPRDLSTINLAHELHKYGVNMRHIGLLRAYVAPPACEGPLAAAAAAGVTVSARAATSKTSAGIMRDRALVEVVVRTLKLVLREFQRRWMKSEQSSSERGMHLLVTQFLNLVTGHHERSHLFWEENVTTGVCQRFGTVALTESERAGLWTVCSERPELLLTIVKELVKVTGVRFKESVNQKLRSRKAKSVVVGFEFHLKDIRDIEAVVTPMAIYQ